jgi:hypothetical protein
MGKLFIPTDRIGLQTAQKSIVAAYANVNKLLSTGVEVQWHLNGMKLESTPLWPEGHYYQCGFSVEDSARGVLEENGLLFEALPTLPPASYTLKPLKIAFYTGRGADPVFSRPLLDVLDMGGFKYSQLGDADIRAGKLAEFDVLMVPGSPDAGECYYAGLGDKGYDQIRSFVAERGHYLGVCGGAYLPLTSYNRKNPFWLDIVAATENEDLDYWRSGSGLVRCRIDNDEHPLFSSLALGVSSSINLVYWEGPAITIKGQNVKPLAHFERLLASGVPSLRPHWDMQDNKMAIAAINYYNCLTQEVFDKLLKNKCAFAEANYHKHKLLLFSPHPEMGNLGFGPWAESPSFLLIFNGLFYLSI